MHSEERECFREGILKRGKTGESVHVCTVMIKEIKNLNTELLSYSTNLQKAIPSLTSW